MTTEPRSLYPKNTIGGCAECHRRYVLTYRVRARRVAAIALVTLLIGILIGLALPVHLAVMH